MKIKLISQINHKLLKNHFSDKKINVLNKNQFINNLKLKNKIDPNYEHETLILYLHGGGFIGGGNELHRY